MSKPLLVIVLGLPGSGKTSVALGLAKELKMEYLSSDKIRKEMFSAPTYAEAEKHEVYLRMMAEMAAFLKTGKSVVVDATFYKESLRTALVQRINAEVRIMFIEVRADETVIKRRLEKPRPDSEADWDVYRKIAALWEPVTEEHLVLQSADGNLADLLQQATAYLTGYDN